MNKFALFWTKIKHITVYVMISLSLTPKKYICTAKVIIPRMYHQFFRENREKENVILTFNNFLVGKKDFPSF